MIVPNGGGRSAVVNLGGTTVKRPIVRRFAVFLLPEIFFEGGSNYGTRDPLQDLFRREGHPAVLVQRPRAHAAARAVSQPRDARALHEGRPARRVLRRSDRSGAELYRRIHRDPGGHPRLLQDVPSVAHRARVLSGKISRHARRDLLQVRGQQHLRLAQAEFRRGAGVLRQKAGPEIDHHRDGRGAVGHGAVHGGRVLRPEPHRVYGQDVERAEAVPQGGHAHVRRDGHSVPVRHHRDRT